MKKGRKITYTAVQHIKTCSEISSQGISQLALLHHEWKMYNIIYLYNIIFNYTCNMHGSEIIIIIVKLITGESADFWCTFYIHRAV